MLKTYWRFISRLNRVFDNIIIFGAFFLSHSLREPLVSFISNYGLPYPSDLPELGAIDQYLSVLGIGLPLFNAFLSMLGAYRSMRYLSYWQLFRAAFLASVLVFLCQGSFLYLLKLDISRSFVATFCILSGTGLFFERLIVLLVLRIFRVRGRNFRNLLIVGTGDQARKLYLEVIKQDELGLKVVGFIAFMHKVINSDKVVSSSNASEVFDLEDKVLGDSDDFETTLKKYAVDEVLFTDVIAAFRIVEELAQIAVEEGVRVTMAADLFSLEIFKSDISYFGTVPLIHYQPLPASPESGALLVKRLMDIVISAAMLVVLSPLMLAAAFIIKMGDRGPVFFCQKRVGLNGRIFTLLKFRSMVVGAEKMLDELKDKNEMSGPVFKLKDDPRITSFGKLIRRYSIDELPQLINVLRGDMSLVGPRPPLPEEVSLYLRKQRKRLSMRPGLTCIWQVSGRNEILDFEQWAKLDLEYIDNWSLSKDIVLLLKTIPVVISGAGAR